MRTAKYFAIQELVPEHVYKDRGEQAWQLIDSRVVELIDVMRERYGPIIINTWHSETLQKAYGLRQWSGLRTLPYWEMAYGKSEGLIRYMKSYSQHKYGRAFDALFANVRPDQVRADMREHPEWFPHLTAIETDIGWVHGDVRNVTPLMEFKP